MLKADRILKYEMQFYVLAVYIMFFGHVQIVTRLCGSVGPVLYWAPFLILKRTGVNVVDLVVFWGIGYSMVGIVLHGNGYPWT